MALMRDAWLSGEDCEDDTPFGSDLLDGIRDDQPPRVATVRSAHPFRKIRQLDLMLDTHAATGLTSALLALIFPACYASKITRPL